MAKNKVVAKEPYYGKATTKAGKRAKLGTRITDQDGVSKVLLNPSGKGAKYSAELKSGKRYTNSGSVKRDNNGKLLELDCCQRAFRSGYLQARKDSAKAYNAKKNGGNRSSSTKK